MNFKTHAPARREGTTLQPNIHSGASACCPGPDGKHVDVAEVRVVVAAVLAAAADAVLAAHHLPKLGDHLVTALAHLHVSGLEQRSILEAGSTHSSLPLKRFSPFLCRMN